jgi:Carbohydrate-selective porin
MTGDWGGARTKLEAEGVTLRAHYLSETAGNPTGGLKQATQYAQQIDFGADLDMGKLASIPGRPDPRHLLRPCRQQPFRSRPRRLAQVQEIFGGGQNFRLAILSYEQSLFDDKLDLKGGWINVGDDFATSPLYCYFQNNAFCGNPVSVTLDAGFSTFPVSSWGGIAKFQPRSDVYVQAGAYEVNPSLNNASNGFKMNTAGATGVIVPVEAGWAPEKGDRRPAGASHHRRLLRQFRHARPGRSCRRPETLMSGRWGLYVLADQMIYRDSPGADRGLTVFAGFTYADPSTALLQYFWEAGLVKLGTFAGRDEDSIGFALSQGLVSNSLIGAQNQANAGRPRLGRCAILRNGHRAQLPGPDRALVQPAAQYPICGPAGRRHHDRERPGARSPGRVVLLSRPFVERGERA